MLVKEKIYLSEEKTEMKFEVKI